MPRSLVFDGQNLLHRVLHIKSYREMWNRSNEFTGGVYGFMRSLNSVANQYSPVRKIVVVWDHGRSKRRLKLYSDYKKRAPITVDDEGFDYYREFLGQQKILENFFKTLGIRHLKIEGYEADDLIWKVIELIDGDDQISIISEDRDFFQLLTDKVSIIRPIAGEFMTYEMFKARYEFPPEMYVLYKALIGDSSDNIGGVKGIGHVTAQKIVSSVRDGYIDSVYEYCHDNENHLVRKASKFENLAIIDRNLGLIDLKLQSYETDVVSKIERAVNGKITRTMKEFDRLIFMNEFSTYTHGWYSSFMNLA